MPRRTRRNRKMLRKKLRRFRKRYNRIKNTTERKSISLGTGFPERVVMTHKYSQAFSWTASTGSLSTYQFGCNNLVQPNITQSGTGHQPYLFDQMAALYNQYTVIGSKISFTVSPRQTAEDSFRICAYIEDDTSITPTNLNTLVEQSRSQVKYFAPDAQAVKTVSAKWSAKRAFGGSVLANNDLAATSAGSPNLQQFFTLGIQGDGVATIDVHVMANIEYITIWAEKKIIAGS